MLERLMQAIRAGDAAEVDVLLEREPGLVAQRDAQGVSPLSLAAYHENADLLERLRRRRGVPDLWEACIVGDEPRVRAALAAGQAIDAPAPDGFTPLGLAVFFRQPALARALLEAGADPSRRSDNAQQVGPIHAAVARRDLDSLARLLEHGGDPNLPQSRGVTPLHDAAASGNAAIAGLLLLFGADARLRDDAGRRACDAARERGFTALAARLER
jgi:ankyrin repeat protein